MAKSKLGRVESRMAARLKALQLWRSGTTLLINDKPAILVESNDQFPTVQEKETTLGCEFSWEAVLRALEGGHSLRSC